MLAPEAVKVALVAGHNKVLVLVTDKVTVGGTVIVTTVLELQAPVLPVKVYVVVTVGEAVTVAPEVLLKPAGGSHV